MILLDSSFLVAYKNSLDVHHPAALDLMHAVIEGAWGPAVLPEYVYFETVTVVAMRAGLAAGTAFGWELLNSMELEFLPCGVFFAQADHIFRTQGGRKLLSFVDCALVAISRARNIPVLATFDLGFKAFPEIRPVPEPGRGKSP